MIILNIQLTVFVLLPIIPYLFLSSESLTMMKTSLFRLNKCFKFI